ncbi:HNH endonuclease signature motif containing protein [Nocardioides sp. zg-1228]|uniref:HNH endonuclease signature motif containing protein n=1 Tax=Nocardioides sp. zg-1228 TaxID=2763008 RepID=UPI0016424E3D|nr:HNH endonuclease signature motif containing protein [Nocardioides sp. zg-1228]MBC2934014.1 DUF222 domain-containing protein [Nocardioides sp. zg-1228]QSF58770.1 DUF222 domain-containing protein [Nocardioides sp. zg-1228]
MAHPILAAAGIIDETLKSVADANPTFMSTSDKAAALGELIRLETRLAELRLRVLAGAGDVAAGAAARDAAGWLAWATLSRPEDARADLRLASAVDRRWPVVGAALREGSANLAQARVIVRALDNLPDTVPGDVLAAAEGALVGHAATLDPQRLAKVGRHILATVAPEVVDDAEARRLAELEAEAHRKTRTTVRRLGDGTTRITSLVPDAVAHRFVTYLTAYTNPRRDDGTTAPAAGDAVGRLPHPRKLGEAFCRLLEAVDPRRLPVHGGDATTLVVTIGLDSLRADLATAGLIAPAVPGDADGPAGSGDMITAVEARRLACSARILPAVLGGPSEVLDLGRTRRLFSPAQQRALLIRDRTCRGEGCDIPGTWAEAHHWNPWLSGGRTDLDDGVLLCSHHHHRAHDPAYNAARLPNGDVRFTRRT